MDFRLRYSHLIKTLPLALAIIGFIGFIFTLSARVTSLEAEEFTTQQDIKSINNSISEIKEKASSIDTKVTDVKDDVVFIRNKLK